MTIQHSPEWIEREHRWHRHICDDGHVIEESSVVVDGRRIFWCGYVVVEPVRSDDDPST